MAHNRNMVGMALWLALASLALTLAFARVSPPPRVPAITHGPARSAARADYAADSRAARGLPVAPIGTTVIADTQRDLVSGTAAQSH